MREERRLSEEAESLLSELDSKIKWEVFTFFLKNPGACVALDTLSSFLCRQEEDVRLAVKGLEACGFFRKRENGSLALSEEKAMLDIIEEVEEYVADMGEKIAGVFLNE